MKAKESHSVQTIARAAILSRVERMLMFEAGVQAGQDHLNHLDLNAVHQMRVFSRRLVAALTTFESCFHRVRFRKILKDVHRLTRVLGVVRDLDVELLFLRRYVKKVPRIARSGVQALIKKLERLRSQKRQQLLRTLQSVSTKEFLTHILSLVHQAAGDGGDLPSMAIASLQEVRKRAEKRAAAVKKSFSLLALHRYRIALKKLRYRMEIFEPYFKKPFRKYLKQVRDMQTLLGNIQDTRVWLAPLKSKQFHFTAREQVGIHALITSLEQRQHRLVFKFTHAQSWPNLRLKWRYPASHL